MSNHVEYDAELCHEFCRRNKDAIVKSKYAGCFYCLHTFQANKVTFKSNGNGQCPQCGYDCVIGDADVPMPPPPLGVEGRNSPAVVPTSAILTSMNLYWINGRRGRPL